MFTCIACCQLWWPNEERRGERTGPPPSSTRNLYKRVALAVVDILTYNDRHVTHLHIKWGVAVGPTGIGAGTWHLPPSRIHAPVTKQRQGRRTRQLFLGRGGVRGANVNCRPQQLSGGRFSRGARQQQRAETTRQAPSTLLCGRTGRSTALLELCRIIPADSLPRLGLLQLAGVAVAKQHLSTFSPASIHRP